MFQCNRDIGSSSFFRYATSLQYLHKNNPKCNARFELFYLFNYLIEFIVLLNNLFDLW